VAIVKLARAWSASFLVAVGSAAYVALVAPELTSAEIFASLGVAAFFAGGAAVAFVDQGLTARASVPAPARTANRPSLEIKVVEVALLCAALLAIPAAPSNWDLGLFATLLLLSVASDITMPDSPLKLSGSYLAIVLAMTFLGGGPACVIGIVTIAAGWIRWRDDRHFLLNNLVTYAVFPLLGGLCFHALADPAATDSLKLSFLLGIVLLFWGSLLLNFLLVASYSTYYERSSLRGKVRILPSVLPSELASCLITVGAAVVYIELGLAAVLLFAIVLLVYEYLLSLLLATERTRDALEVRSKQLAAFQVGMLSSMLRSLDLRDQMTARHSAAVARYSRAIAQRAGYSRREEELVHIAALLHDIGMFALPDRLLKANVPLTDEDWMLIKRHPQQGARVVSSLDGYGPVAEIILAHHERIDGKGYPRGLAGDEIPELARIISVADTYDVMTARDSYRTPMSSYDAIKELRRVAGKQLDARFVEIFIELLEGKDVSFQHGKAADFEKELALEKRRAEEVAKAAAPSPDARPSGIQAERGLLVTA
jgi:putative nucleotidyltransferase with HDIG domain